MKIGFTGHRNTTAPLHEITAQLIGVSIAIHGGAKGFDSQVSEICKLHKIHENIIKPNYALYGKKATFIRNREIVDMADTIVACYDGRLTGGTKQTINYAVRKHKPITLLTPIKHTKE